MPIQHDAVSNSGVQTATASYSWSHAWSGKDRFLSVDVLLLSVPGTTVTSVTFNGQPLTLIASISTVSGAGRVECWAASASQLGSLSPGTYTIAVALSASIISISAAASRTGVHQGSPTETPNSAQATNVGAADAEVAITSVTDGCLIHAACATDDPAITAGQTERSNVSGGGANSGASEDFAQAAAGAKTMSFTAVAALATWAIAGYAIRPAPAQHALGNYQRARADGNICVGGLG